MSKTKTTAPKVNATPKRSAWNPEIVNPAALVASRNALTKQDEAPAPVPLGSCDVTVFKRSARNPEIVNPSALVASRNAEASAPVPLGGCDVTVFKRSARNPEIVNPSALVASRNAEASTSVSLGGCDVAVFKRSARNPEAVKPSASVDSRAALTKPDECTVLSSPFSVFKDTIRNLEIISPAALGADRVHLTVQDNNSAGNPEIVDPSALVANPFTSPLSLSDASDAHKARNEVRGCLLTPGAKKRIAHPAKRPHSEPVECFPLVPCKKKKSSAATVFEIVESLKPLGIVKPQTAVSPRRSQRITAKSVSRTQLESTDMESTNANDVSAKNQPEEMVVQLLKLSLKLVC